MPCMNNWFYVIGVAVIAPVAILTAIALCYIIFRYVAIIVGVIWTAVKSMKR